MRISARRIMFLLEVVIATVAASLGVSLLYSGLFYSSSSETQAAHALLDGWLLLLVAAAFAWAALILRRARPAQLAHVIPFIGGAWLLYSLTNDSRQLTVQVVLFLGSIGLGLAALFAFLRFAARKLKPAFQLLAFVLLGAAAAFLTARLAALQYSRQQAYTLLMLDPAPYFAEAIASLGQTISIGVPIGVLVGSLAWRLHRRQ